MSALKQMIADDYLKATEGLTQNGIFTIKTGNEWINQAKTRPIPKMLFGVSVLRVKSLCTSWLNFFSKGITYPTDKSGRKSTIYLLFILYFL